MENTPQNRYKGGTLQRKRHHMINLFLPVHPGGLKVSSGHNTMQWAIKRL